MHQGPQQPRGPAVTLEVVAFAIHEDVVHEHHAEHAGVDVEVAEDEREVGRLRSREGWFFFVFAFMANQHGPTPVCGSPFAPPPPQVPRAGDSISRGRRHLNPLPRHWRDGGDSCHGVLRPQPHQGRTPGATHVEDGEEHQDGDLEHADLDGDAVPDLDAGRTEGLKGLSTRSLAAPGSSAWGEDRANLRKPNCGAEPGSGPIPRGFKPTSEPIPAGIRPAGTMEQGSPSLAVLRGWDGARGLHWKRIPQNPCAHLKLRLFCRANWMPLTISGSSGTIASTVTPMKYCRKKKEVSVHAQILTISEPWAATSPQRMEHLSIFPPPQILGLTAGSWAGGTIYSPQSHPKEARHLPHAHLGDGGVGEDGADVLRGQVGAGRHAEGGEQEDDQSPPAGPVDHGAVVVAGHWGKRRDWVGHPGAVGQPSARPGIAWWGHSL